MQFAVAEYWSNKRPPQTRDQQQYYLDDYFLVEHCNY